MQAIVQHNRCMAMTSTASTAVISGGQLHTDDCQSQQWSNQDAPLDPSPPPLLVVGYVMKASREEQLSSAGLLHVVPRDGLAFMPLDVSCLQDPQQQQQGHIDILLHKGSDELVPRPDGSLGWSERLLGLQTWLHGQPQVTVVDPFESTAKVNRLYVQGNDWPLAWPTS